MVWLRRGTSFILFCYFEMLVLVISHTIWVISRFKIYNVYLTCVIQMIEEKILR